MNDAQTWTLIAGFLATIVAMAAMVLRVVHTEIAALAARTDGQFDTVDAKIDELGRDIQSLVQRLYGSG